MPIIATIASTTAFTVTNGLFKQTYPIVNSSTNLVANADGSYTLYLLAGDEVVNTVSNTLNSPYSTNSIFGSSDPLAAQIVAQTVIGVAGGSGSGSGGTSFTNVMTSSGDIIYGAAGGAATRLAKGTDGQVLTLSSGLPSWANGVVAAEAAKETLAHLVLPGQGFQNGWTNWANTGQQKLTFSLRDGLVFFSGRLKNDTSTNNSNNTVCTIPNGFEALGSGGGAAGVLDSAYTVILGNYGINDALGARHYITLYRNVSGTVSIMDLSGTYVSSPRVSNMYYKSLTSVNEELTVALPKGANQYTPLKVCYYFHGAGDTFTSHLTGDAQTSSTSILLRDMLLALLDDGWAVVSHKGGAITNHWGNAASDAAVTASIAWLKSAFTISKIVAVGQSMGGLSSLRAVSKNSEIVNWYGIYPVCNLENMRLNASYQTSVITAYGNQAGYDAYKVNSDPMLMDINLFSGKNLRASASASDTVVPRDQHSDLFKTRIASVTNYVIDTHTGNHGNTSAFVPANILSHLNS